MTTLFILSALISTYLFFFGNYNDLSEYSLNRFLIDSTSVKNQEECEYGCNLMNQCRSSIFKPNKLMRTKNCFLYSVIPSEKRENSLRDFFVYIKNVEEKLIKKPTYMNKCSSCTNGWELKYGSCYKSSKQELDHKSAVDYCTNLNSTMAIPKTVQELNFLYDILVQDKIYFTEDNPYIYVWLGGYSVDGSYKNYKWSDGSLFDPKNPLWCEDYPLESNGYYCMEMGISYGLCIKNFNCTVFENHPVKNLAICQKNC